MAVVTVVTSGKGGVGKSTVCAYVSMSLARQGKKVLIIEMDFGMRGLDIVLGVSDKVVYDFSDIMSGAVETERAIVTSDDFYGVDLIAAPVGSDFSFDISKIEPLCKSLSDKYDYIFFDMPAGLFKELYEVLSFADNAYVVAFPDEVSVRAAASMAKILNTSGIRNIYLIINRLPARRGKLRVEDLDYVIDRVSARLLGVIPDFADFQSSIKKILNKEDKNSAFYRIALRIQGKKVPLNIK